MADWSSMLPLERPSPAATAPRAQRLLMTADTRSEVWNYAIELSRALVASGSEIALATLGAPPDREQRRDVEAIPGLTLYPSAYRAPRMDDHWNDGAGHWLLDVAAAVQPTVVHLNDFSYATLPWKAPVLLAAHNCPCCSAPTAHGEPTSPQWRRPRDQVAAATKAADLVVVPTHAALRRLQRQCGHFSGRVIPHGHAGEGVEPRMKARLVYASGSIDDAGVNLRALTAAASRIDWPVCIADAGKGNAPLLLRDEIYLLGHLTRRQACAWLARAPIYAQPAGCENHPQQALVAGLSRCALVLGDIEALREIWDGAALFVNPDDCEALAYALQRLIDDEGERDYYATRALIRARRYGASAMAAAYIAAYAELLQRGYAEDVSLAQANCYAAGERLLSGPSCAQDAD